jgi:hypothetical protein
VQDPEGRQNLQLGGDEGHAKYTDQDDQVVERYIEGGSVKERVQVRGAGGGPVQGKGKAGQQPLTVKH